MNDSLPETHKAETPKKRNLWIVGALGAVIASALVYGVFKALPNTDNGADFARFKAGKLSSLTILDEPPVQPEATFFDESRKEMKLDAFRGKVVLVNLWATWCAPCVMEMPTLANLQGNFPTSDFEVVAISVDKDDTRDAAVAKLNQLSAGRLSFYHDPRMAVVYPMRARGFPTSVLYDRSGKELARLAGEADWNSPEAKALIEAALAKK